MRRPIEFTCDGDALFGTLDEAPGATGLLIVSGGNEIRSGAWSGQAQLAARVAAVGFPVFRFDRRGVGDSEGENRGFRESRADITAALAAFRTQAPAVERVVAFGNCDAASALMLFAAELDLAALLLANPWVVEGEDAETVHAPAALRRRYLRKLGDSGEWKRLASGGVDLRKLAHGLRQAVRGPPPSNLVAAMCEGLDRLAGPATILLAERDRTAQLFLAAWGPNDPRIERLASASHSFAEEAAREWLVGRVLAMLRVA
jgi:exosortase A-associated hydrolase 1